MYAKKVTYTNYNDEEVTRVLLFNLTKTELAQMQLEKNGGLQEYIQKIVDAKEKTELIMLFKELLLRSYGEKSADGDSFMKNAAIREKFECSAAFDVLFMEFATDEKAGADFINGIIPKSLRNEIADK